MRVNYGASFIVAARPSMPYTPMEQPTKASLTAIFISIMMVILALMCSKSNSINRTSKSALVILDNSFGEAVCKAVWEHVALLLAVEGSHFS